MGKKTASKTKGKTWYVEAATFGKKSGGLKIFQYSTGSKKRDSLVGIKPKGVLEGGKAKVSYGVHKPVGWKIHESSHGTALATGTPLGVMEPSLSMEEDQETELAKNLVAHVAETSPDVNALCETYRLRREELGRLTGFSLRALAEWASGKLPSQPAKRRLQEVRRLLDALAQIVKRESIPKWLHQPNPAFERLTPLQVIELGEIDRLWAMVHDLGSGQPD